jgi:hypothetical protein
MIDAAHTPIDKWGLTSVGDELCADEAHVWSASINQPAHMIEGFDFVVKALLKNRSKS